MPIASMARWELRHDLARALGDMVVTSGSMYSTPTATLFRSVDLTFQRADQLRGMWVHLYTGGGPREERSVFASTLYSPGQATPGSIQVLNAFSSAPSTNTGWEVHAKWRVADYNNAIDRAIRKAQKFQLAFREDYANIQNSVLLNGAFHRWANGTTSAPDSWTLSGTGATITRVTNAYQGVYAASLGSDGTNEAILAQDVGDYSRFSGATVSLRARIFTRTSGRVRLRIADGVSTFASGFHNAGTDNTRNLELIDQTLANNPTQLQVQAQITSGSSVTAVLQKMWLTVGENVYEYEIPTAYHGLGDYDAGFAIWTEGDQDGVFNIPIPDRHWYVNREVSPRRVVFIRDLWAPTAGKVLLFKGLAFPVEPSAETSVIEADSEYLLTEAATMLLESYPWGAADAEGMRQKYAAWKQRAQEIERNARVRFPMNYRLVEPL